MLSSSDSTTLTLWLNSQTSPHTRSCYRRDADRLLAHVGKPLNDIGLGDLQAFSESLIAAGLAPVSRVRTLAAVKSLFSFCCRTRYLRAIRQRSLALPAYEQRLGGTDRFRGGRRRHSGGGGPRARSAPATANLQAPGCAQTSSFRLSLSRRQIAIKFSANQSVRKAVNPTPGAARPKCSAPCRARSAVLHRSESPRPGAWNRRC